MVLEYTSVYDELAIFLANLSPRKVLAYKPSEQAQVRVTQLLEKNSKVGLTTDENAEMERYMTVEHIVRLAKVNSKIKCYAMSAYISRANKKLVIERAGYRCEYCQIPEFLSVFDYHIEHIIGLQHGGPNSLNNLAYCCSPCN